MTTKLERDAQRALDNLNKRLDEIIEGAYHRDLKKIGDAIYLDGHFTHAQLRDIVQAWTDAGAHFCPRCGTTVYLPHECPKADNT